MKKTLQNNFKLQVQQSLKGFRHLLPKKYATNEGALVALIMNKDLAFEQDVLNIKTKEQLNNLRTIYSDLAEKYKQIKPIGYAYGYKASSLYKRWSSPSKLYAWEWVIIKDFLDTVKQ